MTDISKKTSMRTITLGMSAVLATALLATIVLPSFQMADAAKVVKTKVPLYDTTNTSRGTNCAGDNLPENLSTIGWVQATQQGNEVKIQAHIQNASPNTTYTIFVRCDGSPTGTLVTDADGGGTGSFLFPNGVVNAGDGSSVPENFSVQVLSADASQVFSTGPIHLQ